MNIPFEVWGFIFSYLELNDLIEVSCVCKDFYRLARINNFNVKRSSQISRNRSWVVSSFSSFCDCSENYHLKFLWGTL